MQNTEIKTLSDIQDIKRIAAHRAVTQAKLDQRDRQANSKFRTQPQTVPNKNLTKQFSQYPKSTSKILSDDTNEDDIPR